MLETAMKRGRPTAWAVLLVCVASVACGSTHDSAIDGADILSLWEERPAPPPGTTIGVYAQTAGAPPGVLVLESREARVCALVPEQTVQPAGSNEPSADAGPPSCPFEQRFTVAGGTERFAVILAPVSASTPPLLAASLLDAQGNVVASVLRRFYPVTPAVDAGVDVTATSDAGSSPDGGSAGDAGGDVTDGAADQ
jgi:hypothetical protein